MKGFGIVYVFVIVAGLLVVVLIGMFLYFKWRKNKKLIEEDQN